MFYGNFQKVKTFWSLLNASKQMKTAKNIWQILSGIMDSSAYDVIIRAVKSVEIFRGRATSVAIRKPLQLTP